MCLHKLIFNMNTHTCVHVCTEHVLCCTVGTKPLFAKESTQEDWEKRGDKLFKRQLYKPAATCYNNASNKRKLTIALAHDRAKKAKEQPDRAIANQRAAILFLQAHDMSVKQKQPAEQQFYLAVQGAAKCLSQGNKPWHAARVLEKHQQVCFYSLLLAIER